MITSSCILGMVPLQFYITLALLILAVIGFAGWSAERDKRDRLLTAARELEKIHLLSAQALQEHSSAKLEQVNDLIEAWDRQYGEEIGEPIPKLTWTSTLPRVS